MSRHNTPTNSHGVTKAAWGAVGGAPRTDVFAVLDDKAHAMAVAAAVARALPLYSTKTAGAVGSSGAASGGAGGSGGDDRASPVVSMSFICDGAADIDLSRCSIVADRVRHAAALVDMPCSYLHTDKFVEIATTTCAEIGAEAPIVISGRELEERGFGGIWGVGKAATHLPALVHLKYVPEGGATAGAEPVCFLGKGIVCVGSRRSCVLVLRLAHTFRWQVRHRRLEHQGQDFHARHEARLRWRRGCIQRVGGSSSTEAQAGTTLHPGSRRERRRP